MNEELLNQVSKLRENGKAFVMVTITHSRGSIPQEVGARVLVSSEGYLFGTIGGGKLETKAIHAAREMLATDDVHNFVEWNLQTDVLMTCGGVVGLFFEKMLPQSNWKIAVFGAGHVAQELVRLLVKLDCDITCIDPRQDWLDKMPDHFRLKKIQSDNMASVLKTLHPNTFIASMTMGHSFDLPILKEAMGQFNFPYIGVIGSDSKSRVLKNDLLKNGIDELLIKKLHCPIGESFGNNLPIEIAISIVAQLIIARDQKNQKALV